MTLPRIARPTSTHKPCCGNCIFWNPYPQDDPVFTLRACYKFYEGDALTDNARSFDPKPQAEVLIPMAMTPPTFKCAKYSEAKENSDGTYESSFQIPEANRQAEINRAEREAIRTAIRTNATFYGSPENSRDEG